MIHLDTNYLILGIRPGTPEAKQCDTWLLAGERLRVSAMAWAEFMCGPLTPADVATAMLLVGRPVPIRVADAIKAAELFNLGGRRRGSLADCFVAAVALRMGATIATENRADFAPFASAGVRVVP